LNGVVEFEDVAGPTAGGDAPLVMIKVIDREANGEQQQSVPLVYRLIISRLLVGPRSFYAATEQDAASLRARSQAELLAALQK
jgi:hypothetical protein